MRRTARVVLLVVLLVTWVVGLVPGGVAAEPAPGRTLEADPFTGTAGPLADGELELAVLSSRATTVTGGDALLGVRGTDDLDEVTLTLDGRDVTDAFAVDDDGVLVGLVAGLVDGDNAVRLDAVHPEHGHRAATLTLTNHPITGPVFSGPHQVPFICRTAAAGLGDPIDDDCSIETGFGWFYLSAVSQTFRPLEQPYDPYPADTSMTRTTHGEVVPYVVRVESSTINRGITRVAVLDDPAARGPDAPFETTEAWNGRLLHQWGASCGVGYHQGTNSVASVLTGLLDATGSAPEGFPALPTPPVGMGYLVAHSTLTTLGTHCNTLLSAETFAMIREHVTEQYGRHEFAFGSGASGGAIQQVTTMDNYPGILDGGVPMVTFPDVITTAMSPADCRLLLRVFDQDPDTWGELERQAVSGHRTGQICRDWDDLFADHLVATRGCHGSVPQGDIYHPEDNPDGVRCTLQDTLVNVMGIDPETGFANRPLDNIGVQYGRAAVESDAIAIDDFLDLNQSVGGYDIDGNIILERASMDADLARKMYEIGAVTGRGSLADAPAIYISTYVDPIPVLGFHDAIRAYQIRERLRVHAGTTQTHAIWSGAPLPNDAWGVMDRWLTDLTAARDATDGVSETGWADEVVATRPLTADDGCVVTTAGTLGELSGLVKVPLGGDTDDPCEQVFQPLSSPRMVAGGPPSEDVIKCSLRPLDRAVDGAGFSDDQWERLQAIFPDGVCDWSQPGVGEVAASGTWLGLPADADFGADPQYFANPVARTTPVDDDGDDGDDPGDAPGRSREAPGRGGDGPPGRPNDASGQALGDQPAGAAPGPGALSAEPAAAGGSPLAGAALALLLGATALAAATAVRRRWS